MIFKRGQFLGFCLVFLLSFMSLTFAVYPEFEFSQTSYSSGSVDVSGRSSSGTQVSLLVNGISVGIGQDVFSPMQNVTVSSTSLPSVTAGIGSSITFVNADLNTFWLKFSNGMECVLVSGGSCVKSFDSETVLTFVNGNNASSGSGSVTVVDELVGFNFAGVENHFKNGVNELKFIQKNLVGLPASQEFDFSVNYQKYSNVITILPYENITRKNVVNILGGIANSENDLFYTVNIDPDGLGNLGALKRVEHLGTAFNATVEGLSEGDNDIYFVTTPSNNNKVFTGLVKTGIKVDTISPFIRIVSGKFSSSGNVYEISEFDDVYINGNNLILNVSSDASVINVSFNNKTSQVEVVSGFSEINLNLVRGQNNLTLIAVDLAGNIAKQAHNINFDDTLPKLVPDTLSPSYMFGKGSGVARYYFEEISGKINKGDVSVTIFSIGEDARDYDEKEITCDMFKDVYLQGLVRDTGVNSDRSLFGTPKGDVGYDQNAVQISLSNLMFGKRTVNADSQGNFDALIGLQEKTYGSYELNKAENYADSTAEGNKRNPKATTVKSKNQICFVMQDKYGNFNIESRTVTLDAGNTMWIPGEITTIPNTIYASEISETGDKRQGRGNVEFGMIARFTYVGSGTVSDITSFRMSVDTDISEYTKYVKVDTSRMNFKFDKSTDEMIVYAPVIIYPFGNLKALDYPDKIKLGFKAFPMYTVGDLDIPIDTVNPIYFQTTINIERPLDHTKWLTPEMIESTQKFLNVTIAYTEKAVEWTGYASVAGVLTCTAYKFKYGLEVASIKTKYATDSSATAQQDMKKELDAAQRKMFLICDRVACTASPYECDVTPENQYYNLQQKDGTYTTNPPSDMVKDDSNAQFKSTQLDKKGNEQELLGRVTDFKITELNNPTCQVNGKQGVLVSADVVKYEKDGYLWVTTTEKTEQLLRDQCVEVKSWVDEKTNLSCTTPGQNGCVPSGVNLQGVSGVCYTPGAPKFDDTRCNAGGLALGAFENPLSGWESSDNVLESITCGCITDTYSHLKNYLKIQKGIYMCLEQAKIGNVKGSYCERLLGQAVCDVATNVVFKTVIPQVSKRTGTDGKDSHEEPNYFAGLYSGLKDGDKQLNDRYAGTFWTQAGLGTDQIVNKACVGAITGDWSSFTDNILSDIDKNEVEPIFGPMIPESRMQGYNPLTGELSIMYRMTYGAVSGGQYIKSELKFFCDKNEADGEYCPDSGVYTSDSPESRIRSRTYSVSKGGSVQDLIVVTDDAARFWFNIVEITHTYELKGATKTYVQREHIIHKGEIIASCYFSASVIGPGAGFNCESIFSDEAMLSMYRINEARLLPKAQNAVFYPGNNVILDLDYTINNVGTQSEFYVAYLAECKGEGGITTRFGKSKIDVALSHANSGQGTISLTNSGSNSGSLTIGTGSGKTYVNLFDIPRVGDSSNSKRNRFYAYEGNLCDNKDETKNFNIKFFSNSKDTRAEFVVSAETGFTSSGTLTNVDQETGGTLPISVICTKSDKNVRLSFAVSSDIGVYSELYDGQEKIGSIGLDSKNTYVDTEAFNNLKEGNCNLFLRLLPQSDISTIGADNFKNYSYGNRNGDDIITDPKLAAKGDMKTLAFRIGSPLSEKIEYFELLTPFNGQNFCVPMDGNFNPTNFKIPFNYIYQTNKGDKKTDGKLSIRIDNERYGGKLFDETFDLSSGNLGLKADMNLDVLKNYLSGGFLADALVSYKFVDSKGVEHGIGDARKIQISLSEDCSGGGVYTPVPTEETEASCKAKEGNLDFNPTTKKCCPEGEEYNANDGIKKCVTKGNIDPTE